MSTPLRILIVEDSEDDADLLLRELRHSQYEPIWQRVETAQAMHDALGRSSWELVISDYSLPAFSGIAALEILKEYALDIPFIMISGAVGEAAAVSAMKAGAHDFVSKDNLGRLTPAVARELREAAARRQHRRAQHQLQESEQRYRDLFQHSPSPMWVYDAATLVLLDANDAATALYGYSHDEFLVLTVPDLHPDEEKAAVTQRMLARDPDVRNAMERKHRKKDGSLIDVEILSRPLVQNGKRVRMTIVKDITDRKRAEERLRNYAEQMRSLSRRLSEVEEIERRNINRELHDRIGPSLVALKLNFHIIRSRLPHDLLDTLGAQLDDAQKTLGASVEQLRNIMADLRPPALDDYGLLAALRTYAGPYSTRLGVPVSVMGEDINPRLTPTVETALFRIAQEALNNIAKHAQARNIRITVSATLADVTLTVTDDGIGFEPQQAAAGSSSWGLRTMRERAQAIGAELRMESAPGSGTRVVVEVPREKP